MTDVVKAFLELRKQLQLAQVDPRGVELSFPNAYERERFMRYATHSLELAIDESCAITSFVGIRTTHRNE